MQDKPYFYDKDLLKVSCYSYPDFIKTLHQLQTKNTIDVNKTLFCTKYTLVQEDGVTKAHHTWYQLFPVLEEEYGVKIDVLKSHVNLESYVMYLTHPIDDVDVEINLEELSFDEPSSEQEDVVEDATLLETEFVAEDVSIEQAVDWDYAESLYDDSNKVESKNLLEEYACKFNVELSKRKSFENMMVDFQEALGE